MLKVEDLRVGNHVYDDYSGIVEIININSQYCYVDYKKPTFKAVGRCEIQYIQPIPITEEWLIKFGFTFTNGYDEKGLSYKSFYKFTKVDGFTKGVSGMLNIKSIINPVSISTHSHIQYVHQLQNLYFALTNEELICN